MIWYDMIWSDMIWYDMKDNVVICLHVYTGYIYMWHIVSQDLICLTWYWANNANITYIYNIM